MSVFLENYKKYKFLRENLMVKCLNCDYVKDNCKTKKEFCPRTVLSFKEYDRLQGSVKTIKKHYLIIPFYKFKIKIKL